MSAKLITKFICDCGECPYYQKIVEMSYSHMKNYKESFPVGYCDKIGIHIMNYLNIPPECTLENAMVEINQ